MYKKILVPLDGSEVAEGVLPHARALACRDGAEITLLRVAVNPAIEYSFAAPAAVQVAQELAGRSIRYLAQIEEQFRVEGFRVSSLVRQGAVAEGILRTAIEIGADVIAMSTHGRSGPERWLLGSVADRVVRSSSVPVLLIRARADR